MTDTQSIKENLVTVPTETLKDLTFYLSVLPEMHHYKLSDQTVQQKSMDADTLRWLIQRELDKRKAGELPYSWGEMYFAAGIPKEFMAR